MVIKMWALVSGSKVKEVTSENPEGRFHPDLIWVSCGDDVKPGWAYSDGEFSEPAPVVLSASEKIAVLESSVTDRWLRGAALGDEYAIGEIQKVEDQIAELRAQ